jgi:hypothetical protein
MELVYPYAKKDNIIKGRYESKYQGGTTRTTDTRSLIIVQIPLDYLEINFAMRAITKWFIL